MTRGREAFVEELAGTIKDMFATGVSDPSAEEIAAAHFPGRSLPPGIVQEVCSRLVRVRDLLAEEGLVVHLTSAVYYRRFRKAPPQNETDARRCIPLGRGNGVEGIRHAGPDDLMWMTAQRQNVLSGTGKFEHAGEVAAVAYRKGFLSHSGVEALIMAPMRASMGRLRTSLTPQPNLPFESAPEAVEGPVRSDVLPQEG